MSKFIRWIVFGCLSLATFSSTGSCGVEPEEVALLFCTSPCPVPVPAPKPSEIFPSGARQGESTELPLSPHSSQPSRSLCDLVRQGARECFRQVSTFCLKRHIQSLCQKNQDRKAADLLEDILSEDVLDNFSKQPFIPLNLLDDSVLAEGDFQYIKEYCKEKTCDLLVFVGNAFVAVDLRVAYVYWAFWQSYNVYKQICPDEQTLRGSGVADRSPTKEFQNFREEFLDFMKEFLALTRDGLRNNYLPLANYCALGLSFYFFLNNDLQEQ